MAEDILSRFNSLWPAGIAEKSAGDICKRFWPSPPYPAAVAHDWLATIRAAIDAGTLPARQKTAPRYRRRYYVTGQGIPGEGPMVTVYAVERDHFRRWLIKQLGATGDPRYTPDDEAAPTPIPAVFTLREPQRDSDQAVLVYKTAKALFHEKGEMPAPSEITADLLGGKDQTGLVDFEETAKAKGKGSREIHLKDGTRLNGKKITRIVKRLTVDDNRDT